MAEEWMCLKPEDAAELEAMLDAFLEVAHRPLKEDGYSEGGGVTI